jgi:glycosyltransferase involved in cell wall biosynthesis
MRASIVVATYNRPELLTRCLAALILQTLDPESYEVIIADNAGTAETRRTVELWASRVRVPVRYLDASAVRGPAAARNAGWRAAAGEIIAFTDDDCLPDPGWLQAGLAAFTPGVVGAWGRLIMPLPDNPTDYERDASRLEHAECVTANCFYRRDALAAVGGFDERFTDAWREDSDLFFSLLEGEGRFVHEPKAVVVHPVRPAPWGVSIAQQRKNVFNALLYKKHPRLYRERIQAAPPWQYYLAVGGLLAGGGGVLAGVSTVATSALAVWLIVTGRFFWRRLDRTSRAPSHVAEMALTSLLIPPLAIYWRLRGAVRYRVFFL